jgi:hypothetical protein
VGKGHCRAARNGVTHAPLNSEPKYIKPCILRL